MSFDPYSVRKQFPILNQKINGHSLIYFDNAATTQKPQIMIDELVRYYSEYNSNIHRGVHTLSQRATEEYEKTREFIAELYNCKTTEVIFTKSDTESLNLIANSLSPLVLKEKSNIIISDLEHHSNIVPWQILKNKSNLDIEIKFVEFTPDGTINIEDLKNKIDENTKIISLNWCSNTFGVINPIEEIIKVIRSINSEIIIVLDAAQSIPHKKFNFKDLNADFITFSAHKLCGPTGVGVLIGKEELLNKMSPFLGGGDMIREVSWDNTTYNDLPYKFEAGTPNIADVIAFRASLKFLYNLGFENILKYEKELAEYLINKLKQLDFIEIYGTTDLNKFDKISLVSFNIKGVHAHDVGSLLDENGIAVRSGHHCTQLIMKRLNIPASVRASLYIYNTKNEVDLFIDSLNNINIMFNK